MKYRGVTAIAVLALTVASAGIGFPSTSSASQRSSSGDAGPASTEKVAPGRTKAAGGGALLEREPKIIAADPSRWAPNTGSDTVIGSIDTNQLAPEGIGLVELPQGGGDPGAVALLSPSALSAGYGCAVSCIEEGLAYARGFGAELVVSTSVPTTLFFGVIELSPGYPPVATTTLNLDTDHSWAIDSLEPGHSYGVTVVATDGDGNADLGYGEFTTLSTRNVSVEIGDVVIDGGPSTVLSTSLWLGLGGLNLLEVTSGAPDTPTYSDVDRFTNVSLLVRRFFDSGGSCAAAPGVNGSYDVPDQGHSVDACIVWNTARVDDLDLDVVPPGVTRWNKTSFTAEIRTPNGAGQALPADFADDWWLHVVADATFHVTYS